MHKNYKSKSITNIVIALAVSTSCFAQSSMGSTGGEKSVIKKADRQWKARHYAKALALYQNAFVTNPQNSYTNFQIGAIYYLSDSTKLKALPYLRNAISYFPSGIQDTNCTAYYDMGYCYMLKEKYDSAALSFESYKSHLPANKGGNEKALREADRNIEICKTAPRILKRNPDSTSYMITGKQQITKVAIMGAHINSQYPEYAQLVYDNDSSMLFTSSRPDGQNGQLNENTGKYYEDIYASKKDANGDWSAPTLFTRQVHIPSADVNMATMALINNNTLLIFKNGRISELQRVNDKWSRSHSVNFDKKVLKKYFIPSVFISADQTRLLFVANISGGLGGKDIYMCTKDAGGNWSAPENLGSTINTVEDEESPYLMPDNTTLYFSSKGHGGLGGYDIFVSRYVNGTWSQPQNLGAPINSPGNDIYMTYNDDQKKGYFSSSRINGSGSMDIYSFSFEPKKLEPKKLEQPLVKKADSSFKNTVASVKPHVDSSSLVITEPIVLFKKPDTTAYSASKPIPVAQHLTTGVIFAVQVGAFRKPIPQDLFKGFKPITGIKAPEGYVRYTAGVYASIAPAREAAEKIRKLGYSKAFVVAYYDGKRISLKEAIAKLGTGSPAPTTHSSNVQTVLSNTQGK